MRKLKAFAIFAALLGVIPFTVHAAGIALGEAGPNGLSAVISPDTAEIGSTVRVYMAAKLNGRFYLRSGNSSQNWVAYQGGALPVAASVTLAASTSISVVDFDISSLTGLEVYVAYGASEADIFKPGHLAKVHTVGAQAQVPGSATACDTAAAPEGISYAVDGNKITVTTNGRCIPVPQAALCTAPAPAQATGLSVLTNMQVANFQMSGISINIPGMPNPFEQIGTQLANSSTCLQNVPADYSNYTIEADVCYDITDKIDAAALQSAGAFITVTPPITEKFQGTLANTPVADCFASGAATISDAFTKELWIKQADGTYLKP